MPDEQADVLVIGGGPAGSTAAFQLASAGLDVLLVDRAVFPREKVCGESLSPGAIARLRAIGLWTTAGSTHNVPGSSSPSSMSIRGMRIRSPGGTTFVGNYRRGTAGPGLVIRRISLDAELLARARARGARVREGVEAVRAAPSSRGTAIVEAREVGRACRFLIEAKRVAVCDGRGSLLARELGFVERGNASEGQRRFAVRAHYEGVSDLTDLAEMQVGYGGYCGVAPLSFSSANICYVLFSDRLDLSPKSLEAGFRRHLGRFPDVARRLEESRVQGEIRVVGPLRLTSRRQSHGPYIACGDTTGFLDPFTGEGISHAIASAVLGAEAICESIAGRSQAFGDYEDRIRALRRVKRGAALLLFGLVSRPFLANAAATLFSHLPPLGDAVVQWFGDRV
jgi:flavin-dependent dehydrogenase